MLCQKQPQISLEISSVVDIIKEPYYVLGVKEWELFLVLHTLPELKWEWSCKSQHAMYVVGIIVVSGQLWDAKS